VAGLNVTGTATGPGGGQRITIRGNASISRGNQPLIVVDGIHPTMIISLVAQLAWGGQDKGDEASLNLMKSRHDCVERRYSAALYGLRIKRCYLLPLNKVKVVKCRRLK
jgi:hypothetical protein